MADLEERILEDVELQPGIWSRYIYDMFFVLEHGEDSFNLLKHLILLIPLSNSLRIGQEKK